MFEKLFPVWNRRRELRKAMRRYRKAGYPVVQTKMCGRDLPPVGYAVEVPEEIRIARAAGDHVWGVRK